MHTQDCILIPPQCIQNKLLKTDTLKTRKFVLNYFYLNFSTLFLVNTDFYVFKRLYFLHSSILEFGRWSYNQQVVSGTTRLCTPRVITTTDLMFKKIFGLWCFNKRHAEMNLMWCCW